MRTAIYARKSTESEDRQVQSLEDQIRELTDLARREGFEVAEVYQESKSAKEPGNRPEFERLVGEIKKGRVDAVLTWSINRLSRNPVDGGIVAYLLQTGRLRLIRTAERSYRPEDNALLLSIENGMATAYIQDLRRNVMRGMRGKVERGWHTCKAPLGYLNHPDTRKIVPDPQRFPVVRQCWEMMLEGGHTISDVHRFARSLGLTTSRKRGTPQPVSLARFHTLFRERFYVGEIDFGGKTFPGRHEPMVSAAEFAAVQDILDDRYRSKNPKRQGLPFAGCMRCARCGCAIVGETKTKRYVRSGRVVRYTYYRCSGFRGCPKAAVREEDLALAVAERLSALWLPRETAEWLKDALLQSVERDAVETATDAATLKRERARHEARLRRLAGMRLDGEFSAVEHSALRTEILGEIDRVDDALRRSRDSTDQIVRTIRQRLDAAVRAGELQGTRRDPLALAAALRILGTNVLNLETGDFRFDPMVEKIAGFEPLGSGSQRPITGDLLPLNSVWWSLVSDLRTLATEEFCCANDKEIAWRQRMARYSWKPRSSEEEP